VRALAERGIDKCHLMVVSDNHDATAFWTRIGWVERTDIRLMSHTSSGVATAKRYGAADPYCTLNS